MNLGQTDSSEPSETPHRPTWEPNEPGDSTGSDFSDESDDVEVGLGAEKYTLELEERLERM